MPNDRANPGIIDRRISVCIRARRELLGLSVQGLAARLGCPPSVIEDYEAGRLRVGAIGLMRLAEVLKVEIGYFVRSLAQRRPRLRTSSPSVPASRCSDHG